jgi:hypothetical protein
MAFVDGLRGLAALAVVLPHTNALFRNWSTGDEFASLLRAVGPYGGRGVDVFFVLSGFVITHVLQNQRMTPRHVGTFLLKRVVRLSPPYYVAIALFCLYLLLQGTVTKQAPALPSAASITAHLVYLQGLLGYGQLNVVYWTLCVEFQFYLFFCAFLALCQRRSEREPGHSSAPKVAALLFGLALVYPAGLLRLYPQQVYLPAYLFSFLAGALVCWTLAGRLSKLVLAGCAGAMTLALAIEPSSSLLVTFGTAAGLYAAGALRRMNVWLSSGAVQFLGRVSYSFYLVHVPIALSALGLRTRFAPSSPLAAVALLVVVVLASLALAEILYRTVELPALNWSRRITRPRTPVLVLSTVDVPGERPASDRSLYTGDQLR